MSTSHRQAWPSFTPSIIRGVGLQTRAALTMICNFRCLRWATAKPDPMGSTSWDSQHGMPSKFAADSKESLETLCWGSCAENRSSDGDVHCTPQKTSSLINNPPIYNLSIGPGTSPDDFSHPRYSPKPDQGSTEYCVSTLQSPPHHFHRNLPQVSSRFYGWHHPPRWATYWVKLAQSKN